MGRDDTKTLNRRERGKRNKLSRIKRTARELFVSQGFENTTIRQISEGSDVGIGTVFNYFNDKSDLLITVFEEDLEATWQAALAEDLQTSLLQSLELVFLHLLRFYAQTPKLSKIYLREVLGRESSGDWSEKLTAFLAHLENLVVKSQERGETAKEVNPLQAAKNFFALYYAALTGLLSASLTADLTVQHFLRPALELQLRGMMPQEDSQ